jgi:hypothetical protein
MAPGAERIRPALLRDQIFSGLFRSSPRSSRPARRSYFGDGSTPPPRGPSCKGAPLPPVDGDLPGHYPGPAAVASRSECRPSPLGPRFFSISAGRRRRRARAQRNDSAQIDQSPGQPRSSLQSGWAVRHARSRPRLTPKCRMVGSHSQTDPRYDHSGYAFPREENAFAAFTTLSQVRRRRSGRAALRISTRFRMDLPFKGGTRAYRTNDDICDQPGRTRRLRARLRAA